MNNSYVIQWKSKVNGRAGRGTKRFEKEEVEGLVEELNREYPQIEHQAVPATEIDSQSAEDLEAPGTTGLAIPRFSLA
ncbi:MAG TPA: hypothetical protein VG938_13820 [Verrucomicrobiae bacterium]|jgi:hypothetical protein|nr:hypothetical protein [Verrucomicrobiae bacterium]